jgi:murein DD-endopeptidase MepM/ murein hydrolase activator NlpD
MSKFPYLQITASFVFILSSCSVTPEKVTTDNFENRPVVSINKETNTIKKEDSTAQNNLQAISKNKTKKRPTFDWPVWEARMSRGFLPNGTKKRRRPHKGIDLAATRGTAVMSSHDGLVIYTGKAFKGYGKMIMIESTNAEMGGGYATLYGHLDKIVVFEGQKVRQGEVIGALGNTGRSSGPHLHFEIRKLDGPIDPLPFLPAGEALTNEVDDPSAPEE